MKRNLMGTNDDRGLLPRSPDRSRPAVGWPCCPRSDGPKTMSNHSQHQNDQQYKYVYTHLTARTACVYARMNA